MKRTTLKGRTALVTGASSGLGVDFAHIFAEKGCDLVLVARRKERLEALAEELESTYGVSATVVAMDLADPEAPATLHADLGAWGIEVEVLVNNAGYGTHGEFVDIEWERERDMLQLDILSLVHMTKLFSRDMVERGHGYILQVASIAGYQPSPTYASYAAAKAFVLSFGEAIAYELRNTGVTVSVLSPGMTRTEFLDVAGQRPSVFQRMAMMESRPVAEEGVNALLRGAPSRVSGFMNKVMMFLLRFAPRRLMAALAYNVVQEPESEKSKRIAESSG